LCKIIFPTINIPNHKNPNFVCHITSTDQIKPDAYFKTELFCHVHSESLANQLFFFGKMEENLSAHEYGEVGV
jgi:hypothetical protein